MLTRGDRDPEGDDVEVRLALGDTESVIDGEDDRDIVPEPDSVERAEKLLEELKLGLAVPLPEPDAPALGRGQRDGERDSEPVVEESTLPERGSDAEPVAEFDHELVGLPERDTTLPEGLCVIVTLASMEPVGCSVLVKLLPIVRDEEGERGAVPLRDEETLPEGVKAEELESKDVRDADKVADSVTTTLKVELPPTWEAENAAEMEKVDRPEALMPGERLDERDPHDEAVSDTDELEEAVEDALRPRLVDCELLREELGLPVGEMEPEEDLDKRGDSDKLRDAGAERLTDTSALGERDARDEWLARVELL